MNLSLSTLYFLQYALCEHKSIEFTYVRYFEPRLPRVGLVRRVYAGIRLQEVSGGKNVGYEILVQRYFGLASQRY